MVVIFSFICDWGWVDNLDENVIFMMCAGIMDLLKLKLHFQKF
jgi:hypothetical protein